MPNYPEHALLKELQPKSQAIHEFIDWLQSEKRICLAEYLAPKSERMYPTNKNVTGLVAEFLEIDLKALENEKLHMIEESRKASATRGIPV